jgi:hypothetical protein
MSAFHKYIINDTDTFDGENYPLLSSELAIIRKGIALVPQEYKADIITSFYRDHSLKNEWITANPGLASIITSGSFSASHIESLFEACRMHKIFLHNYEEYITASV